MLGLSAPLAAKDASGVAASAIGFAPRPPPRGRPRGRVGIRWKSLWTGQRSRPPNRREAFIAAGDGDAATDFVSEIEAGLARRDAPAGPGRLTMCGAMLIEAEGRRRSLGW